MKIWERINQVKGTTETKENILNWMEMNRVCPLMISDCLEEGEQSDLQEASKLHCIGRECGPECYREYLERELCTTE